MKKFLIISEDTAGLNTMLESQADDMDQARAFIESKMLPFPGNKKYFVAGPIFEAKVNPATLSLIGFEPGPAETKMASTETTVSP
jgi:hypothetical protein